MSVQTGRTEFVDLEGGRIAYDVVGDGPVVVLSPGIADTCGTGWGSYIHTDTAGRLIALIRKLGGPAVVVGQSFSGAATTIAAAMKPDLVRAIVEIDPFTRSPKYSLAALLRDSHDWSTTTSGAS